ncbi:MAG: mechanosensitive ion channel [Candidatus Bathyarchaeota archaeon]|nr:mechanosensitive ion channel [Candidatus Bathyarchaeota archaeon]
MQKSIESPFPPQFRDPTSYCASIICRFISLVVKVSSILAVSIDEAREKVQSLRRGSLKTVLYIAALAVALFILNFIFGWESLEKIPVSLQPYGQIILFVQPFLIYVQAGLIFVFGYLAVNAVSGLVYTYMRRVTDHPTAAAVRSISRISGVAILVSLMASVFQVNAAAALTVGSFGGLVVGFATQTILSHVVAGVFLLVSRPFTYGDTVTVAGQTGLVKEIKLMHLVLEDEEREILIPSGNVVTQIIQKKKPKKQAKPVETVVTLDAPARSVVAGSPIVFTGRLVEATSGDPVTGAAVKIMERDIGRDELLASGTTGSDGSFSVEWTAKKTDRWDNDAEIYAKYEGDKDYNQSESRQHAVTIARQRRKKTS